MPQDSPAAETARMVRSASTLTVHCNMWGLWYASRRELLGRGVMMDPGRTTLSSLWASLLGELPHTPNMADPASLSMAKKLFSEPGAEDFLPGHPLMVRMQQVRKAMSFLESRDADVPAEAWPRPQATVLRLVQRLRELLRRENSYAPLSSLELIIDHMEKHPGFSFGFLQRFGVIRFVDSDYFSPRELHLLRLLCLRHPNIDFTFEIYSNAVDAVFEHDFNLYTSLENKIGLSGEQGCFNMQPVRIEPKTTTAFSSLVGQHPKSMDAIDGKNGISPVTDVPRLQVQEASGLDAAMHTLDALDTAVPASAAAGDTVVAVCGGDVDAEVTARLSANHAVSAIASRSLDSSSVYARLRLPFEILSASSGDLLPLAALACDCLPPDADHTPVRQRLHPWLSLLTRKGVRLGALLDTDLSLPPDMPAEIAAAFTTAVELLRCLRDDSGETFATALYGHWQRVASSLLRRLSRSADSGLSWLDRMSETGAALALGRQITASCFDQGESCCFAEVEVMLHQWGSQRLVRVLEAGEDALLVSTDDAPVAPDRSHVLFFGADAHRWPGFGSRHPLGEVSASVDTPASMTPGADPVSVALQRLSQWGAVAGSITLLTTLPVSSNDDIPPATPLLESMDACIASAPKKDDKDDTTDSEDGNVLTPLLLPGPDIFGSETADAGVAERFRRLLTRSSLGPEFAPRYHPRQPLPDIDEDAGRLMGMLGTSAGGMVNRAMGEKLELLSPSRLNHFYRCPYAFLITEVLKIVPPEEAELGLARTDEGSMVHGAMARLYRDLMTRYGKPVWLPGLKHREDLLALADRHSAAEVRAKRQGGVDIGEPLARRIAAIVRRVVNYDLLQQKVEHYQVSDVEVSVRHRPPGTAFSLHGIIDRVETMPETGAVRLLDLKVSAKVYNDHLSVPSEGRSANFQMPLYVMMACGEGNAILPSGTTHVRPGLLAALAVDLKDEPNRKAPEELFATCDPREPAPSWMQELTDQICRLHGQMSGGVYPPWPVEKACEYCPLGPACRCE